MGKITRAYGWDEGSTQRFLTINPLADEKEDEGISKVLTRKGFDGLRCSDYSPVNVGVVATGQNDGTVKVFDILSQNSASITIQQKSACNTLSFNSQGLIAAGFEKPKQENALHLYNINHYSSTSNQEISYPTLSYVNNESITSTIFYNETNLLVGGTKTLRDIDIRVSSPIFQMSSKATNGITQDPYNHYLFSAFAEDGTLAIYDRRKLGNNSTEPALIFNKLLGDTTRRNNNSCFRYSTSRRGEFATSHAGELIRRWQTGTAPSTKYDSVFVASVQDVKTKYDRVISFDYSHDDNSNSISLVCMRQSGSVFKMPVVESQKSVKFNSFNDLLFSGSDGTFLEDVDVGGVITDMEKIKLTKPSNIAEESENDQVSTTDDYENGISNEDEEDDDDEGNDVEMNQFFTPQEVLENDISVRMRRRAFLGYGVDCLKNIEIIQNLKTIDNTLYLRSTWKWLDITKTSAQTGLMTSGDLDLSYEGILGIWKGIEGIQKQNRYSDAVLKEDVLKQRITQILANRGSKTLPIVKSTKEPQRRLCLIVAGWYFSPDELEQIFARLSKAGQYSKAAAWAVFTGDVSKAVTILASSKSGKLKLIATAISGYLVQQKSTKNTLWKDQCRNMASELDDPYLRAIFAYIADNDWWDVLDESLLPLRERLGVALRCLPDKDLTLYLTKVAQKYISKGELEGLILTGITPRGIDLIQSYVDRTSDVQTAALITSFGCPRYFTDERAEHWLYCYRSLLNSWGMFSTRAKFDVARAKLSANNNGQKQLKISSSQVHLQCIRCNKNISKSVKPSKRQFNNNKNIKKSLSVCPHCGAALPRCAICLLSLGKSLPQNITTALNEAKVKEFKEWPSFCLTCNHGMHAGHAEEWFSKNNTCPVPGCSCQCNNK
ncbi:WD repeat-containing protein [Wickerhamomyces ciferrii]|uniref:WD repeat-containing protein n=1 Tax=Wickerhamomyces ciferrii (strain ATCC 14091 / BCRC 22168 / CBS 111 / JCM 3599 / NBRC 0793 / NRRL Y-1031 F-60-10) TaxID=1206466 RepID=K0KW40_WICCF|nr:WD repeat-containing protein [Wickerhamomyces ciferrii]CCH45343.1 WD repeat-containing protein [Wickerhamomyces ciferrii]